MEITYFRESLIKLFSRLFPFNNKVELREYRHDKDFCNSSIGLLLLRKKTIIIKE